MRSTRVADPELPAVTSQREVVLTPSSLGHLFPVHLRPRFEGHKGIVERLAKVCQPVGGGRFDPAAVEVAGCVPMAFRSPDGIGKDIVGNPGAGFMKVLKTAPVGRVRVFGHQCRGPATDQQVGELFTAMERSLGANPPTVRLLCK